MLKSFAKLTHVDPGFDFERLLVFNIGYPSSAAPAQQTAFYQQVIEQLRALPGATSAAAISRLPFSGGNSTRSFTLPGDKESREADVRVITPEYFQAMRIPVLKGRAFTEHDSAAGPLVCVINAAATREVFGTEDPVGKFIMIRSEQRDLADRRSCRRHSSSCSRNRAAPGNLPAAGPGAVAIDVLGSAERHSGSAFSHLERAGRRLER